MGSTERARGLVHAGRTEHTPVVRVDDVGLDTSSTRNKETLLNDVLEHFRNSLVAVGATSVLGVNHVARAARDGDRRIVINPLTIIAGEAAVVCE